MNSVELPLDIEEHMARVERVMENEGVADRRPLEAMARLLEVLDNDDVGPEQKCEAVTVFETWMTDYLARDAPPWRCEFVDALQSVLRVID